jgi:glutamine amidotransferase
MPVTIVDYGMANLRSVAKAFEAVGVEAVVVSTAAEVTAADRLVLPGVGAFKDAVATLRANELDGPIIDHVRRDRPMLGICLGLQMLFDTGYEDGEHRGLGILGGTCVRFDVDTTLNLKVPHMGWNQLDRAAATPLLDGLDGSPSVYFVHGYHVCPTDPSVIATTTDYGRPFVSSIRRGNLVATQFHPEKSQAVGLKMLENFARI